MMTIWVQRSSLSYHTFFFPLENSLAPLRRSENLAAYVKDPKVISVESFCESESPPSGAESTSEEQHCELQAAFRHDEMIKVQAWPQPSELWFLAA